MSPSQISVRQLFAQRVVDLVEDGLGGRIGLGQSAAHADGLGALPRKDECAAHGFSPLLWFGDSLRRAAMQSPRRHVAQGLCMGRAVRRGWALLDLRPQHQEFSMPARNSDTRFGTVTRVFHWLTALLILTAIPAWGDRQPPAL